MQFSFKALSSNKDNRPEGSARTQRVIAAEKKLQEPSVFATGPWSLPKGK
jgi:hypothetical protein